MLSTLATGDKGHCGWSEDFRKEGKFSGEYIYITSETDTPNLNKDEREAEYILLCKII